ncbi:hypothetical protein WJX81_003332 [Elliptochloris bilobata]|uniref:Uncharacterized protein n=1 Tax=Elliptochloris bilobata TaxID=381761 RepID=A0AAW1RTR2_9CHLO
MKYMIGKVVSDRMDKSIMVAVERWMILPKYGFRMKRHSKIMAHDENNECRIEAAATASEQRLRERDAAAQAAAQAPALGRRRKQRFLQDARGHI